MAAKQQSKETPPGTRRPPLGAHVPDEDLFRKAPERDECPICFLTLSNDSDQAMSYEPCCGKIICVGCRYRTFFEKNICPFCRHEGDTNDLIQNLAQRVKIGDPKGMYNLGIEYRKGRCVRKDSKKAIALFLQAAEHGDVWANSVLSDIYLQGSDGVEQNTEKADHHRLAAAMGGHKVCRFNLGFKEAQLGNLKRAAKHFILSASDGHEDSLKLLGFCYKQGCLKKEDYASALRAYQKSRDAVQSKERDHGLEVLAMLKTLQSKERDHGLEVLAMLETLWDGQRSPTNARIESSRPKS